MDKIHKIDVIAPEAKKKYVSIYCLFCETQMANLCPRYFDQGNSQIQLSGSYVKLECDEVLV